MVIAQYLPYHTHCLLNEQMTTCRVKAQGSLDYRSMTMDMPHGHAVATPVLPGKKSSPMALED